MANSYTTTELISTIKLVGNIPPAQTPFTNANILTLADNELQTALLRQIVGVRENYFITTKDFTIVDASVYDIPPRAIAMALDDIKIINGTTIYNVARTEIGDQFATNTSVTGYFTFFIENNKIHIVPNPQTGQIRFYYNRRPNTLIPITQAAQITAINTGTFTVTVAAVPSTISTSIACDLIQDQPGFLSLEDDTTPTATTSTTITFSSLPDGLAVGDWVSPAGQSPVPQIPVEFRPLLIQRVVVKYYELQGYKDKMSVSQKKLDEMEKDLFTLINPRVAEESKTAVANQNIIGGFARWLRWSNH